MDAAELAADWNQEYFGQSPQPLDTSLEPYYPPPSPKVRPELFYFRIHRVLDKHANAARFEESLLQRSGLRMVRSLVCEDMTDLPAVQRKMWLSGEYAVFLGIVVIELAGGGHVLPGILAGEEERVGLSDTHSSWARRLALANCELGGGAGSEGSRTWLETCRSVHRCGALVPCFA